MGTAGKEYNVNYILKRSGDTLTTINSQVQFTTVTPSVNFTFNPSLNWSDFFVPKGANVYTVEVQRTDTDQFTTVNIRTRSLNGALGGAL